MNEEEKICWWVKVSRINNGYILDYSDGLPDVAEDDDNDDLSSHQKMLWKLQEFFSFTGSKHDPDRIIITRKKQ